MTTFKRAAVWGVGMLGLVVPASASDISWTFQRVEQSTPGSSAMLSLGMRTGATWPTVFCEPTSKQGALTAASLTPVGWSDTTLDMPGVPSFVRSAAGADGRLGAAWQATQGSPRIQFGQFTASGWQLSTVATLTTTPTTTGANAPDVAYLPGNRPVVAYADVSGSKIKVAVQNALGWESEAVSFPTAGPTNGTFVSTAVDTEGDIGVAYYCSSRLIYAEKSIPGGSWSYAELFGLSSPKCLSLAYGPHNEVGVAALQGGTLSYAYFDVQSGLWQNEVLTINTVSSSRVDLMFDGAGHPCLAYVGTDRVVHYRTNDGGGWLDVSLPAGLDVATGLNTTPVPASDAALALDRDGVPVISYYADGGLILAYDPVITPEPATLLAIMATMGIISRRQRRA